MTGSSVEANPAEATAHQKAHAETKAKSDKVDMENPTNAITPTTSTHNHLKLRKKAVTHVGDLLKRPEFIKQIPFYR